MLNGRFGLQLSGTAGGKMADIAGIAVPGGAGGSTLAASTSRVAGIVLLVLDGSGTVSGTSSVNLGSTFLQGAVAGAYTVNDDCSATFTLTDASNNAAHFSGVLVAQGSSLFVTQTDLGAGVSGQMQPLRGFCETSDLAGTFGLQYSGTTGGAGAFPFTSTGLLSLDGQGNATASEMRFNGASFQQVASTGTVTVNPDCSVNLTLAAAGGTSVNLLGAIRSDVKQVAIVQTDAGTAVTGVATAQ
jgi:hypothetical protein